MTPSSDDRLSRLVEAGLEQAAHHTDVEFGPVPLRLSGCDELDLDAFTAPLAASAGDRSWKPLTVVMAHTALAPLGLGLDDLSPRDHEIRVIRGTNITLLAIGSEGSVFVFDRERATVVRWRDGFRSLPPWEAMSPLRHEARWWSVVNDAAMVHTGAVAERDGERAILFVGNGGAGKSTTSMACFGGDLEVLGDDHCFVEPLPGHQPRVHPMYRYAKLDDRALQLLPGLAARVVGVAATGKKLIDLGAVTHTPRRVVGVCSVVQDQSAPTAATPLSRVQGLRAVAPSTMFQMRLWERETWDVLAAVARSVPCYRLSVSSVEDIPGVVTELIEASP